jgi:hypothetical protein
MLSKIEAYLRSYLSFPNDRYFLPLALFAVLEHCWNECFDEVPYLSVCAMVKGAGKTRVLELLQFLAGDDRAVLVDGSVTVAALYTEIEQKKVILIDESEKLQSPRSPFRPILNGGYRRGQVVIRKMGKENVRYSIYCPKAFAQIGDVYDSLRDRCIIVEMQRTISGKRVEYVRQIAMEKGSELASEIENVLGDRFEEIRDAYLNYHELYASLNFVYAREKEIWKPLFTLCQVFAPERVSELTRSAADIAMLKSLPIRRFDSLKAEEDNAEKLAFGEHLLRDVIAVIGGRDKIATAELMQGLRDIDSSPWRAYEVSGITEISLATLLRPFNVVPNTIRIGKKGTPHSTAKGYNRADFTSAAATVLGEEAAPSRNPVTLCSPDIPVKAAPALRVLPSPSPCSGCRDMHKGIAEMAKANPGMSDEELAVKSGCSVIIVRQAKARYLDWKKESE